MEVELNEEDLFQIRLCRTAGLVDLSTDSTPEYSMVQPRLITVCPCGEETESSKEAKDKINLNSIKSDLVGSVSDSIQQYAWQKKIIRKEAVSIVNFIFENVNSEESGKGVMMDPEIPVFFKERSFNFFWRQSAFWTIYDNTGSMKYRGPTTWYNRLLDPVPMNVAFGYNEMNLELVEHFYPLFWKKHQMEKDKKKVIVAAIYLGRPKVLDTFLSNSMHYDGFREFMDERGGYDKMVSEGKIIELYISLENDEQSCKVGTLTHLSHSFVENASPINADNPLPVKDILYIPEYPIERPYVVKPDEKGNSDGVVLRRYPDFKLIYEELEWDSDSTKQEHKGPENLRDKPIKRIWIPLAGTKNKAIISVAQSAE